MTKPGPASQTVAPAAGSDERLRVVLESMPSAIALLDRQLRYVAVSRRWLTDYALEGRNVVGASHYDIFPEIPDRWKQIHQRALAGETVSAEEESFNRSNGSTQWLKWQVSPWHDAQGIAGILITTEDITTRKIAAEGIKQSRQQLQFLADTAPIYLAHCDVDGRFLFVNQGYAGRWGLTPEQVIGKTILELLGETGYSSLRKHVDAVVRGEPVEFDTEIDYPLLGKRVVRCSYIPEFDSAGHVRAFVAIILDITDRKRIEESFREGEDRFRLMADSIPHLAWMARGDGSIFWYNQRWFDYTGTTLEEMQGWGWEKVHDPNELGRVRANWTAALSAAVPWEDIFPMRRHDGQMRRHLSRARPLKDSDGRVLFWFGTNTDIEDQLRKDELLDQTRQRLELAINAAGLGTFYCPMPLGHIEWNATCKEHFWLPPDAEVDFDIFYARLHPDDRQPTRIAIEKCLRDRLPYDVEYRTVAPDGRTRWVRAKGSSYFDADGNPTRFDGITIDISEQKRAETALRERENVLRSVTSEAQVGLVMVNKDRRYLFANQTYVEILGITEKNLVGKRVPEVLAHAYDQIGPKLDLAFAGQRVEYELHLQAHPVTGDERFYDVVYEPRLGEAAEPYVVVVIIDSTHRKQVEQALRDREAALHEAQRVAHVGSWRWDARTDLTSASDELCRIFGLPAGQPLPPVKKQDGTMYPHHSWLKLNKAVQQTLQTGTGYSLELEARRGLDTIWVLNRSEAVRDSAGQVIALQGTVQDVTELHQIAGEREQLLTAERQARAEAEQASRLKDEFLATLSHELRTPLNAILGWVQILGRHTNSPEELAEGLGVIERNGRVQAKLVEDLLDLSRITSGKMRIDVQKVDLAQVIRSAIDAVRPSADAKDVRIQMVLDDHVGFVRGDPARLLQAVWNVVSNAIKFTDKGGKVQVALERVNSHVEITVTDSGLGIPPDFLPHVFERFRQADGSTTRRHGGLGIGLAIVKSIVEAHGGRVRAKSAGPGQGAAFSIELPLMVVHDPHDTDRRAHPRTSLELTPDTICEAGVLDGVTVLVVDDEQDSRELIRRVLADCRAHVQVAASAAEGLQVLDAGKVDVILSDIGMPDVDGYEFIRLVRARGKPLGGSTPAAALTAFARSEDRRRALLAGYQLHVTKPVERSELITVVASLAGKLGSAGVG